MRVEFGEGNALEDSAQRYWAALRKWRGIDDPGDMTIEQLIAELNDLQRYRGRVAFLAQDLLDDVIHDRRPEYQASNDITPATINSGQ